MGAKLLEDLAVRRVLWFFKKLNEQFLDSDQVLFYFYGDITKDRLTPEDIRLDLDFELLGISETITKEATINQLISAYNLAINNPMLAGFSVDLFTEIMRLMQTGMDTSKLKAMPPPPAPGVASVLTNPNVSASTEDAVLNQIQQNGASAPNQIPQ
jgi:hypothetical protein